MVEGFDDPDLVLTMLRTIGLIQNAKNTKCDAQGTSYCLVDTKTVVLYSPRQNCFFYLVPLTGR